MGSQITIPEHGDLKVSMLEGQNCEVVDHFSRVRVEYLSGSSRNWEELEEDAERIETGVFRLQANSAYKLRRSGRFNGSPRIIYVDSQYDIWFMTEGNLHQMLRHRTSLFRPDLSSWGTHWNAVITPSKSQGPKSQARVLTRFERVLFDPEEEEERKRAEEAQRVAAEAKKQRDTEARIAARQKKQADLAAKTLDEVLEAEFPKEKPPISFEELLELLENSRVSS